MRARLLVPAAIAAAAIGPLAASAGAPWSVVATLVVAAAAALQALPGRAPRLLPRNLAVFVIDIAGADPGKPRTQRALIPLLVLGPPLLAGAALLDGAPPRLLLLGPLLYAGLRGLRRPTPGRDVRTLRDAGAAALADLVLVGGGASIAAAAAVAAIAAAALPRLHAVRAARAAGTRPIRGPAGPVPWLAASAVAGLALALFVILPRPWPAIAHDRFPGGNPRERPPAVRRDGRGGGVPSDFTTRSITMGEIGRLQKDPRPVLEVTVVRGGRPSDAADLGAFFRSGALESFDGVSWAAEDVRGTVLEDASDGVRDGWIALPRRRLPRGEAIEQRLRFLAGGSDALFSLGLPHAIGGPAATGGIVALGRGEVRAREAYGEGAEFTIRSVTLGGESTVIDPETMTDWRRDALLEIPEGHGETAALARAVLGEWRRDRLLLRRLETWIAGRCSYSLDLAPPGGAPGTRRAPGGSPTLGKPPVEAFLFGSRRGHCELFASAAAVMLRSVGVPARIAIGFRGGEFDPATGTHTLRGADAHAWVEAWISGEGWVTFDPTPAARRPRGGAPMDELDDAGGDGRSWFGSLLSFDGESQRRFVADSLSLARGAVRNVFFDAAGGFRVASTAALVFGLALLAFALARRAANSGLVPGVGLPSGARQFPGDPPAPEAWAAFLAFLAARGIRRAPAETPLELAARAAAAGVGPDGAPARLADAYARERWGGRAPDPAERRSLVSLARSLASSAR